MFANAFDDRRALALEDRIRALRPEAPPLWGSMSPAQALCHLADALRLHLGDRTPERRFDTAFFRTVGRFLVLSTPIPLPKGTPTAPEMDAHRKGTPPGDFDEDREALLALMHRFREAAPDGLNAHVLFGPLSRREWGRWVWRHTDHHLRQFGV